MILKKSLEGISQKVLTDSLRSMEADGIITRTVYPEVPPRVEYALNDLGQSMRPIIMAMEEWGINYKRQLYKQILLPSIYLTYHLSTFHFQFHPN